MEKLTHDLLSPYLPYKVKMLQSRKHHYEPKEDIIVILDGIVDVGGRMPELYNNELIDYFNIMYRVDENTSGTDGSPYFKPIFHPITDLTKKIEHNEKEFVPEFELVHLQSNNVDAEWLEHCHEKNWSDEIDWTKAPYHFLQKLFEWHFDVFGLIKEGRAIDINTIELTP